MALTGTFEVDFAKFETAVEQADVSLKTFQSDGDKVAASLSRIENSLTGVKVVQQATLAAEAVARLGDEGGIAAGLLQLTDSELQKLGATAQEATAKLTAMGQDVPPGIQAIADAAADAQKGTDGFVSSLTAWGAGMIANVASGQLLADGLEKLGSLAVSAAAGVVGLVTNAMTLGNTLFEMSLKTGASVENLSRLRYVAGQTGVDFESFNTTFFKMEQSLGAVGAKAVAMQGHLDDLHLSLTSLRNEKPDQAFLDIVSALEKIPNPAQRAADGAAIFGRGWKEMAGLASVNIQELMDQADKLGVTMTTMSAAAAHAADAGLKALGAQLEAVGTRIGAALMPAVVGLTHDLGDVLTQAVQGTNKELNAMGGGGGFLATLAAAMGTGSKAIDAQVKLYDELRAGVISFVRNAIEPAITAGGMLMQAFDAMRVIILSVEQGYDGLAYAAEGALYYAIKFSEFTDPLNAKQYKADAAVVSAAMDELYNTMGKNDAQLLALKKSEEDWGASAKSANATIEASVNAFAAHTTDVLPIIQKFADESTKTFGGVSTAIDTVADKSLKGKFEKSLAELTEKIDDANQHNVSYTEKLKLFGAEAEKAAEEAKVFGVDVSDSVQDVADAYEQEGLDKILAKVGQQARTEAEKLMKDLEAIQKKAIATMNKNWEDNAKLGATADDEAAKAIEKQEADSLDRRLALVNLHFQKERDAVKADASNKQDTLDRIAAAQAAADAQTEAEWARHVKAMSAKAEIADLTELENAFKSLASEVGGSVGKMLGDLGKLTGSLKLATEQNLKWGGSAGVASALFSDQATSTEKFAAAVQSGAAIASAAIGAWTASANAGSTAMGALKGAMSGAEAGAMFGPWGAAIGAAGGALLGFIHNLNAGRDAVVTFANSMGGFPVLQQRLEALGAAGQQLWVSLTQGSGNQAQAAANIKAVTDALNAQSAAANTSVQSLTSQITALGGSIDPALDPYIQKLQQANVLTAANATALQGLEGSSVPTYQQLDALATKYNLSLAQMGPAFDTSKIDAGFQTVIDDMDELQRGGVNVNAALTQIGADGTVALSGLGTQVQSLIDQSQQYGVDVPANMKPAAQAMIDQGVLLDANGQKITDINQIKFGETMQTSLDALNTTLQKLIQTLTGSGPNSLASSLNAIGGIVVKPKIQPVYDTSQLPSNMQSPQASVNPATFAAGSATYTGPAAPSAAPINIEVTSNLDGKVVAQNQVQYIPGALTGAGR